MDPLRRDPRFEDLLRRLGVRRKLIGRTPLRRDPLFKDLLRRLGVPP